MQVLTLLSIVLLGGIAWSDFKHREIPVVILSVEAMIGLCFHFMEESLASFLLIFVNVLLTLTIIGLLYLWFRWRYGDMPFFDKVFGWGDVFLLGIASLFFNPLFFLYFIVLSAFVGSLFGIPHLIKKGESQQTRLIPLAGIMAGLLAVLQLIGEFNCKPLLVNNVRIFILSGYCA